MAIRVKVSRNDFEEAESQGWVDGLLKGKEGLWVYVELGTEQEYIPSQKDDSNTEYRLFIGCDAFFANSQEILERGDYQAKELNVNVIIYT